MTRVSLILLGLGILLAYMPKWTRPDLFFAVTVGTDFAVTPQARRILYRYWLGVALHVLIAWCLAGLIGLEKPWALLPATGWLVAGSTWATARAHRATAHYATAANPVREASLSARPQRIPGGWLLFAGPLLFLAAAAVYAQLFWEDLPQRIAVHWGMHGANRWVDRTPVHVFGFLALLAAVCIVLTVMAYGTLRWSRTISVSGERARGEARFRRGSILLQLGVQYLIVIPAVVLAFWSAAPAPSMLPLAMVVVIGAALIALIRMGQGGSRMVDRAEYQPPVGDHTPDAAWKWGLVYYNPDDPALIVERRIGIGYTLNFANRWSWVLMAVILAPVVLLTVLR
jgi:uncharacterized membrane protein